MGVQTKRWTREEYDHLVSLGVLGEGDRLQLIAGEIVEMVPQGAAHAAAVHLAQEALRAVFPTGHMVRAQLPLAVGDDSEPEPDIAVVAGDPRTYAEQHPAKAVLVVEVSDATLEFDRTRKAPMFAAAGIPEYWIVNLPERVLEVHRDPDPSRATYGTRLRLAASEVTSVLACPGERIRVADLLP